MAGKFRSGRSRINNRMVFLRGVIIWIVIMFAESLHGVARVILLEPRVGDFKARQIGVFTGAAVILIVTALSVRWIRAKSVSQLLGVGLLWLALTLGFEIGIGRFVAGYSWERIASDYNILEGGLLPIGLLVLTLAPVSAAKARDAI
ncbi:MAG: hypothetical protein JMDDDDMK_05242 [Acidobacteria bacterium]|nr:hypothetical protein [Acidobacteriota bacterium]